MIAMERGLWVKGATFALAAAGVLGAGPASAQQSRSGRTVPAPEVAPAQSIQTDNPGVVPKVELKRVPVNPSDAIAVVNGEVITRQQLSDECIARKGEEILETLINRRLIEQALKAKKLEVTATEIDREIDNVAKRVAGIGREAWLRTLDKERGISPVQYARDIIYPALALRKLAAPMVQVTDKDVKNAFEAQYGDKIRCRLIMVDSQAKAVGVWERVRKNPAGFEKLAQEESMDSGSRSLGGLLAEPIARHAYPQTVSDSAFRQLVDGDADDRDPSHKPKDGSFTGPIQVAEATWVVLKRESLVPAQTNVSLNDEGVRQQVTEMIYEVKLKEAMGVYFVELMKASQVDNKLTGRAKLANEEAHPDHRVDGDVKLMGNGGATAGSPASSPARASTGSAPRTSSPPVGAPTDDALSKQTEALKRAPVRR